MSKTENTVEKGLQRAANRRTSRGVDQMERNVNRLSGVIEELRGDLWLLIYDIPTALDKEAPNPSGDFWLAGGFRLNLSCWVFPDARLKGHIVQSTLRHWAGIPAVLVTTTIGGRSYTHNAGVKSHKIKFAADQVQTIREIARETLREELVRIHTSLIERLGAADERLTAAQNSWAARGLPVTDEEAHKAGNAHISAVRSTLRDSTRSFVAALESARAFDETESLDDLFAGVRAVIRSEVLAFNAQAAILGITPVTV